MLMTLPSKYSAHVWEKSPSHTPDLGIDISQEAESTNSHDENKRTRADIFHFSMLTFKTSILALLPLVFGLVRGYYKSVSI
jgi:hypothetical protein